MFLYKIFIETTNPICSFPGHTCKIVALRLVNNICQSQTKSTDNAACVKGAA